MEHNRAEKFPSKITAVFDKKIQERDLANKGYLSKSSDGWVIGNLKIPHKILIGGEAHGNLPGKYLKEFSKNELICRLVNYKPIVPLDVQELNGTVVNEMEKLQKETGMDFFNGGCFRLHQFFHYTVDKDTEDYHVVLEIGETDFYSFVGTNCALDKPLNANETIRTKYIDSIEFFTPENFLSNRIAIVLNVFLEDGSLIVVKRSSSVALRPGTYQTSVAGGMKRKIYRDGEIKGEEDVDSKGVPSPFVTAVRECMAELNIKVSEEEVVFLALSQDQEWLTPILIGEVRLNLSEHDLFSHKELARERCEIHHIEIVDFNPQNIRSLLRKNDFAADSILAIILSLMHRYSEEEVRSYFTDVTEC